MVADTSLISPMKSLMSSEMQTDALLSMPTMVESVPLSDELWKIRHKKYGTHSGKLIAKSMENINLKIQKMQPGKSSFLKKYGN